MHPDGLPLDPRPARVPEPSGEEGLIPALVHDLKNPLGVILAFAEAIPESTAEERAGFCERLRANAAKAVTILDDYACLADLRAGKLELAREWWEWDGLVERILTRLSTAGSLAGIRFERSGAVGGRVLVDAPRVIQAARCLFAELTRLVPDAGERVVSARAGEGWARLEYRVRLDRMDEPWVGGILAGWRSGARPTRELAERLAALHEGRLDLGHDGGELWARLELPWRAPAI